LSIFIENTLLTAFHTTIFERETASKKRFNPNQPKHWHEYAEHFDNEFDDECYDVNINSEDLEILHSLQDSCEESEGGAAIEKGSDYEYDTNYADSGSISDEVPPRHRVKREKQVK
jgi:hypothetical protein